jgi:ATP-dependent DNA helicase RecQ
VEEEALFERLRALRKQLADEQGVPAYIVLNDRSLRELAARRPASPDEMLEISGIGPAKLERYGAAFLRALAD